jgi:hypothetical protein
VSAVVFLRVAFGFFAGRRAADAVGYGGGGCVVDGGGLVLGGAFGTENRSVSLVVFLERWLAYWTADGYLHWGVLCCGGIFAGLHFLGGLFGCWVSGCCVDLVESRLCWPGRVESVGHGCGGLNDRSSVGWSEVGSKVLIWLIEPRLYMREFI